MKSLTLLILLFSITLVGCNRSPLVGRWSLDGTSNGMVLEFKANGQWERSNPTEKGHIIDTGTYTVDGNKLTIHHGKTRYEGSPDPNSDLLVKVSNAAISELPIEQTFEVPKGERNSITFSGAFIGGTYKRVK